MKKIKEFIIKMILSCMVGLILLPPAFFFFGFLEHSENKNSKFTSTTSWYDDANFPMVLYSHDSFINFLFFINKANVRIYKQVNGECTVLIKELSYTNIDYWTIIEASNGCTFQRRFQ